MNRLKIDTSDKKPSLWNIVIVSAITFIFVLYLLRNGWEKGANAIVITMDIYFLVVTLMLVRAFFQQLQYNPYSYNTIFYAGFSLFLFSILVSLIHLTIVINSQTEVYSDIIKLNSVFGILVDSATNYMIISAPFVFVFSLLLCISNISLIRHEGLRLVNVLGIILALLMIGGELFLFRVDFYASGSLEEVMMHSLRVNLFAASYLYFECMLIGAIIAMLIVVKFKPELNKDYMIILGCGIKEDGTPVPLLKERIDRALAFRNEQLEKTGKDLKFVVSGGQGDDEVISEATSMKLYLMKQGIEEKNIIKEDKSVNTYENMKFSKEKIVEVGDSDNVAFSTTNYHVFRGGLHARTVGMRAQGVGAKTKWYFWPNAAVREFVGLLSGNRFQQALIIITMVLIYTIFTLVAYNYLY